MFGKGYGDLLGRFSLNFAMLSFQETRWHRVTSHVGLGMSKWSLEADEGTTELTAKHASANFVHFTNVARQLSRPTCEMLGHVCHSDVSEFSQEGYTQTGENPMQRRECKFTSGVDCGLNFPHATSATAEWDWLELTRNV